MGRTAGFVPAEVTSFLDSPGETAEIKRLLSACRLVTVTGVAGVGKSRLSRHVAAQVRPAFPDGVWLVDLADVEDPALVPDTVAGGLGVPASVPALLDYLWDRQLLLVLDNCEHLLDACTDLAATLLSWAAGLRVLCTTRQALGVPGEHIVHVAPMAVPSAGRSVPGGTPSGYPALDLFAERAAAVLPGFAITDENAHLVAAICRGLDGLPLAIELAASRVRAFSLDRIAAGLDDRYKVLAVDSGGVAARHRTLVAAVGRSYDLCTAEERLMWARASVFADSFDLAAAEAVCTGGAIRAGSVLDAVTGLIDKSVLAVVEDGAERRYRLLETLRAYGWAQLRAAGEQPFVRRRHCRYYVGYAERVEAGWFGRDQLRSAARTRREHPNLRSALEYCLATPGEAQTGLRLAGTLWFYWIGCGLIAEGRQWLDRALRADATPGPARDKALSVRGYLALLQGDRTAAERVPDRPRREARDVGVMPVLAAAVGTADTDAPYRAVALVGPARTVPAGARVEFDGLRLLASIGSAALAAEQGDPCRAAAICETVRATCTRNGEHATRLLALELLVVAAWARGHTAAAHRLAQESLQIARTLDANVSIAVSLDVLAAVATARGTPQRAAVLHGAAQRERAAVGAVSCGLGFLDRQRERSQAAVREAVGVAAYSVAFRHGADLGLDAAVAYALDVEPAAGVTETIGSVPPPSRAIGPVPLTRREAQVAELVALGLSNKQIAHRLLVAQRTAESHVEHILAKLGFTSRVQVAFWVSRSRTADRREPAA